MKGSKSRILKYFKSGHSLTSKEAFELFGITRLSARIKELRELGYNITTIMVDGTNRYGEPVRYGLYKLIEIYRDTLNK